MPKGTKAPCGIPKRKKGESMKTYVVKAKYVREAKGLQSMARYLFNESEASHKNTEIVSFYGNEYDFVNDTIQEEQDIERKKILAKKGGRTSKIYAQSLTFNFPKAYKPTVEQCKKITDLLIQDYSKIYNIDEEILKKRLLCVLHKQDNTHINILFPITFKSERKRDITLKSFVEVSKKLFTTHTDKVLNVNHNAYIPKSIKTYDKKTVQVSNNYLKIGINDLLLIVNKLKSVATTEKSKDFLNGIMKDLQKGHTINASKKIDKFVTKNNLKEVNNP